MTWLSDLQTVVLSSSTNSDWLYSRDDAGKFLAPYEALAEVESELEEKEHLNIIVSTGEPAKAQVA